MSKSSPSRHRLEVVRLDVPMQQAGGVRLAQRSAACRSTISARSGGKRPEPLHERGEVESFEQLHDEVEAARFREGRGRDQAREVVLEGVRRRRR